MSSWDEIKELVGRKRLFEIIRRDLRSGDDEEYRRWIYASADINKEIGSRRDEPAFRRLSAQFQSFIIGATIPVALLPDHENAEWARLEPAGHELWESRVRHQRPELRVPRSNRE